ncbi:MAG TPA: long-chain fatty acid--CoA ligase [Candidatus Acidoferrales bacterium]|nr:long-chain fatty acid--CoA ligase [Candidatus Acidoferrales bacterium]
MSETLVRIFLDAVERRGAGAMFVRKQAGAWESISADRALADVESLALGLAALGVTSGDRVGLLAENRYEWAVSDLAVLGLGAITVPIYPTLTAHQCEHVLADSQAKVAIVSTPAQLEKLGQVRSALPALASLVVMDGAPAGDARVRAFAAVLEDGGRRRAADPGAYRRSADALQRDGVATIIYTSGTTGEPKGAMLTHGNICSNVEAGLKVVALDRHRTCLSFLPLCHIFERMAGQFAMLAAGVVIAYAQGIDTVAADAVEIHPTVLIGVPRFFEKVYARVMDNARSQPPLRRMIFGWGVRVGTRAARERFAGRQPGGWLALQASIADRLVGAKVRERVGGLLRLCVSGGAPLAPKVMEFFFAIGIPVVEGYGLTETSPVICLNPPGREKPGSVGPPVPGVEVRIGDEGEILTRGPHVMRGYFRNEEATAAVLRDGWFHTGDVGRIDADGYLVITDRLKDLLVTAGGKKVAPQPLEAFLKRSRWISEAVMLGDRRPYCVALIVPNFVNLETRAKQAGWPDGTRAALLAHPEVRALYQREIDALNAERAPFEQIKRFALLDRELSEAAGELTPTLKVRRRVVSTKFENVIESLYAAAS